MAERLRASIGLDVGRFLVAASLATLVAAGWTAASIGAIGTTPSACLDNTYGSLWATPQTVPVGVTTTTLQWSVQVPTNCPIVVLRIGDRTVARQGSMTVAITGT